MLTARGFGLLIVAVTAYLGGRLIGTYELFLVAFALLFLLVLSSASMLVSGTRLRVTQSFGPDVPVAGDRPGFFVDLRNRSLLPVVVENLAVDTWEVSGSELMLQPGVVGPRGSRSVAGRLGPVKRGEFEIPSPQVTFIDPLGLARWERQLGEGCSITVYPRLAKLTSCVLFQSRHLGQDLRRSTLVSHSAMETRGVRPHQPGEPLNRIHWKSTAKTGHLMLRETEESSHQEVMVVIDGNRGAVSGDDGDDSFEASIQAGGSISRFMLQAGFDVGLLLNDEDEKKVEIAAGDSGQLRLLQTLAVARPDSPLPVDSFLRRREQNFAQGAAVVLITPSFNGRLLSFLGRLGERSKTPVFLVHVNGASFVTNGAGAGQPLGIDQRRFLLRLQSLGVPSVVLNRGDDLETVLSSGSWDVAQ